jgi:hypothetical protein
MSLVVDRQSPGVLEGLPAVYPDQYIKVNRVFEVARPQPRWR